MLASQIPTKFPIPWGFSAGTASIRTIPTASQIPIQTGAASLTDGFPPINFVPIQAGGVPPFGEDFNGILNQITDWNQWQQMGGPITYDATFANAIGGYPRGSTLLSNSGHAIYECLADNNLTNPNASGTNWRILACLWSVQEWAATGPANVQILSLSPSPASYSQLVGIPFTVVSPGTNTGAVTLNINGMGAVPILNPGGGNLFQTQLLSGFRYQVIYIGGSFQILSPVSQPGRQLGSQRLFGSTQAYVPSLGTNAVLLEYIGGGGAGGGAIQTGAGQCSAGAGGGSGGFGRKYLTSGFSGQTITIGAGGGGVVGGTGGTGGSTSFGSICFATGGFGGTVGGPGPNSTNSLNGTGVGGSSSGGDLNCGGYSGQAAFYSATPVSGKGAGGPYGDGGSYVNGTSAGVAATNFGAAGSGGTLASSSGGPAGGGAGFQGLMIITEYS